MVIEGVLVLDSMARIIHVPSRLPLLAVLSDTHVLPSNVNRLPLLSAVTLHRVAG